jgi:hypothetical protein
MCPVCIATAAAWIAAGTASTGGISALVVSKLRGRNKKPSTSNKNHEEGERHGQEQ